MDGREKSASGAALGVAGGAIALKVASAGPIADLIGRETMTSRSVVIMRSASERYASWKDCESTPQWMEQIQSVTRMDVRRARWERPHPGVGTLAGTAEMTEEVPNRFLAWRTIPGSDYQLSGRVEFTELQPSRGAQVTYRLTYKLHGSAAADPRKSAPLQDDGSRRGCDESREKSRPAQTKGEADGSALARR